MDFKTLVTFQIESWDEETHDEYEGGWKLTRAVVQKKFTKGIEGTGSLEYLMIYTDEGTASFVGFEHIAGSLGNRSGSFVLQHVGTYAEGISKAAMIVIPDSGTGELSGLCGKGDFEFGHAQEFTFTLEYSLGQVDYGSISIKEDLS